MYVHTMEDNCKICPVYLFCMQPPSCALKVRELKYDKEVMTVCLKKEHILGG